MSLERLGSLPWWKVLLWTAALGGFAVAQPLLDLLGRNPEFFVARGFTTLDLILFPLVVLAVPALLALPVLLLRMVGRSRAAGATLVALLGLLFALLLASAWVALLSPDAPWPLPLLVAVAGGAGLAVAVVRSSALRTGASYAIWAIPVFALWFIFMTGSGRMILAGPEQLPDTGEVANPVPIVLLVFDEFPLATLIDSEGQLLAEQFPNFARLAADGVWYRNTIGVRQQTEEAVPTILTGVGADGNSIPISADHPLNLFTLLSEPYNVAAVETVTELCPRFVCANSSRRIDPFATRWGRLGVDLAVVYGHLTLPRALSDFLPAVDQTWGNFTTGERSDFDIIQRFLTNVDDDRRQEVDRLLATFDLPRDQPPLRFAHFLYPHHPWELVADGRRTGAGSSPGAAGTGWGLDPWLVAQGYQRLLLQTQYVDTVLGRVMDKLKTEGIYDETLLIAMGDHGITVRPGVENQRRITPDTIGTVAAVPLFVKYPSRYPGVVPGTVDEVRAETWDVLPTITEVIGVEVPWDTAGMSLLDSDRTLRTKSVMSGPAGSVEIEVDGSEVLEAAAEKGAWFPGGDPWALVPPGWEEWLGRPIAELSAEDDAEVSITVRQQALLDNLSPGSDLIPVFLSGQVMLPGPATADEVLVVAVDGVVRALTRVFEPEGRSARFEVMVPPQLLRPGRNDVVVWLAGTDPGGDLLLR